MSSTPEKMQGALLSKNLKDDVVPAAGQSPDAEEAHMDRDGPDAQAHALGYEFEVKEQDRWLPIANGAYTLSLPPNALPCPLRASDLPSTCTSTDCCQRAVLDADIAANRVHECSALCPSHSQSPCT
jgi:hypothetical protein